MLKFVSGLLVLVALFSFACGGDDDDESADVAGSTSSPAKNDKDSSAKATPTSEELEKIVHVEVPGFTALDPRTTPLGATVVYRSDATTAGDANVQVLVTVAACDPFICSKLDPNLYSSPEAQRNLKSNLSTVHIENPNLKWDFGQVDLSPSAKGLYTYALSYVESKDSSGGTSRASANGYHAWYNDGRTYISLEVFARGGDSPRSVAEVEGGMSKAEAEKAASDVFAALEPSFRGK